MRIPHDQNGIICTLNHAFDLRNRIITVRVANQIVIPNKLGWNIAWAR